ncbi:hypothetical protein ACVNS2_25530 [Paenibacillus caseinilyticus]|uniref:Uncharacterized protein n=1 Tax=Paenibacillus mucilaginosus K02 TaxID=997761 RepID=I0BNU0_9BACL|nr:hypothetical protein [Paenibacillus mucilaginosus]AFH64037.1 hypothetical protein B2K_25695 [Paenibacillus mucilaginosus K02]
MSRDLLAMIVLTALIGAWSWRDFKGSRGRGLWLTYGIMGVSLAGWIYLQMTFQTPRPTVLLQKLLEPYVPPSP